MEIIPAHSPFPFEQTNQFAEYYCTEAHPRLPRASPAEHLLPGSLAIPLKAPWASLASFAHPGLRQRFRLRVGPKLERGAAGTGIGGNVSQGRDVPAPSPSVSFLGLICMCFYARPHKLWGEPQGLDFKKEGWKKHTHTHAQIRNACSQHLQKLFWVLHDPKSPQNITKNQPGDGFGTPNPIQRCSLLHSPFQPDLRLRLRVEALKHPFTSLSQVTDFLLHLISGCQQMLFPQQKPHSTCYSYLKTTLSFLPFSRPW